MSNVDKEKSKCKCDNLQNGDIVFVDNDGKCKTCGRGTSFIPAPLDNSKCEEKCCSPYRPSGLCSHSCHTPSTDSSEGKGRPMCMTCFRGADYPNKSCPNHGVNVKIQPAAPKESEGKEECVYCVPQGVIVKDNRHLCEKHWKEHAPKESNSSETRKEKLERGAKDFANRFEGVMKELAEEDATPSPIEPWDSKVFGDLRNITLEWCDAEEKNDYDMNHIRNSVQFGRLLIRFRDYFKQQIKSTEERTRQEILAKVREMKKELDASLFEHPEAGFNPTLSEEEIGYNQCLSDLEAYLEKK